MRTAFLAVFISLWLVIAIYVAVLVLLPALLRRRHGSATHPTLPSPGTRSSTPPGIG